MEAGNENDHHSALYRAVVAAMAEADWEMTRFKNAQKHGTTAPAPRDPQDVASAKRKPGGQPGNGNALKTG